MNEKELEAAIQAIEMALLGGREGSSAFRSALYGALDHLRVDLRAARRARVPA